MKKLFEGGEDDKNEAGPLTDRPPAEDGKDEQLAEGANPPETELVDVPKAQDETVNPDATINQSVEQPLTGSRTQKQEQKPAEWSGSQVPPQPANYNTVTKAKSKKPARRANNAMRRAEPTCFESIVDMVDRMMAMVKNTMRWLTFWMSGGASNHQAGLGDQYMAEPEYKPSMMEIAFRKIKDYAVPVVFIYLVIVFLISNFDIYGDLKSQALEVFKRRVHYYDLDLQLNGIASLVPAHFFQRFAKLDIIELIECSEKGNERACYSAARRTCIAKYTTKNADMLKNKIVGDVENVIIDAAAQKKWEYLECMYEALHKSTIRMGDFCDYHFDRNVENIWTAADVTSLHYFDQRYDCRRRQYGRHVRYCVERDKKLSNVWSTDGPEQNLKTCEKCFEVNNNEDFELSGCTAEQLCTGRKDAKKDCKRIYPKDAVTSADGDGRPRVSDIELVRGDGSDYRGKQSRTRGDVLCQAWDAQEPNSHYITKERYPNGGLDQNYCRNPDGNTSIWCFTMEPNAVNGLRWDFCNGIDAYREWQGCMRKSINPYFFKQVPQIIDPATLPNGCYKDKFAKAADKLDGCTCHASCKVCGYGSIDFVQGDANRCLTCTDPLFAVDVNDNQDFGTCKRFYEPSTLADGCYADKFTDTRIDGCNCDPACKTCGYGPTSEASKPGRCLSCPVGFTLKKVTDRDYGICEPPPSRRRLAAGNEKVDHPLLKRTREDRRPDAGKALVSHATERRQLQDRFDSSNRYRVKQNSSWQPCIDARFPENQPLQRYDAERCTSAAESCGYYRLADTGEIEAGCILTQYCDVVASIWKEPPDREIKVKQDMVTYNCGLQKVVKASKGDLADWTSLLQNDKHALDGATMRQCFKRFFDREINTYLHIKQDYCDFEFLYVSQDNYFQKFYNCEWQAGRSPAFDYQTCRDVWLRNFAREEPKPFVEPEKQIRYPYYHGVAFRDLQGHCRDEKGRVPDGDELYDAAVSTELGCRDKCINTLDCAGYERHPETKRCQIFIGRERLRADGTAGFTCRAKVSQQMLTQTVEAQGPGLFPLEEGETCTEQADCHERLVCGVYRRGVGSTPAPKDADDLLADWNKTIRQCIDPKKDGECNKKVVGNEWAVLTCLKVPGTLGPDEPCEDTSECWVGYSCARAVADPADELQQDRFNDIPRTCYLSSLCYETTGKPLTTVNGFATRILCNNLRDQSATSSSRRRRRLADIELDKLPAGCYEKEGDYKPKASCTCHASCKSCGFGAAPTAAEDCLACKDPLDILTFEPGKRTGKCSPASTTEKPAGCYSDASQTLPISGCQCDKSCRTCGYSSNPLPTSNGECLTCADKDHVVRRDAGEPSGRCTLPSTGTEALVTKPTREIWEGYQDRCNKAYYDYFREGARAYNGCDDWLAENFPPLFIIDKPNEAKVLDLNKQYKTRWETDLRKRRFREDSRAMKDFLELLEERYKDLEDRFKERITIPSQCKKAFDWINEPDDGVNNEELALKADSCYILGYSGLLDHTSFVKCMRYSLDGTDFERGAIALFYRPGFASIPEEQIKQEFEAFMEMPYTDFAKCFMEQLSPLTPKPIDINFAEVASSPRLAECLAEIDRDNAYQILSDDIAPSLEKIQWYQKYEQLESLKRFIDDRDMESYCSFKFAIFKKDYARQEYCEALLNVKPKPQEYCTKFEHQYDDRKFHYPLVYKYSCYIKNNLAFGDQYGVRIDPFYRRTGCNTAATASVPGTGNDKVQKGGFEQIVKRIEGVDKTVAKLDGAFDGNYLNCQDNSIFPALMDCFSEINMFKAQECFEENEDRIKRSIETPPGAGAERPFPILREEMDHYFYRMTSKVTDEEINSYMCEQGKQRTGMALFSSPWADEDGISMDPRWFLMQCSTFSEGVYIGDAFNSVDLVTHYYFDQPLLGNRTYDDPDYEDEVEQIVPVALNYNPLPYIFEGRADELPDSDIRNYVLVNRTATNYQRFRFQAAEELSQVDIRSHAMYHDYGANRWYIDSPAAFDNFTNQANTTLLWSSRPQQLGLTVVGNDFIAPNLVSIPGESEMNTHVDFLVTKRIIGIPIEWKNQTQFQVILRPNDNSAERGSGIQRVGATQVRVHSHPSFQQDTVLKIGFTENKYTYQYYYFEDIIAQLGGLFTAASALVGTVALVWAWHSSFKISMMMKRKAQKQIQMIKIKQICDKLPRIEAEIQSRLTSDSGSMYENDLRRDLNCVQNCKDMPEKYYEQIAMKARTLKRLEDLYDCQDVKDMSAWERHCCAEDDAKIQHYQDRLAKHDFLGRQEFFQARITYLNMFKMFENIDMLNIKVKKMKHQIRDLYCGPSSSMSSGDAGKGAGPGPMTTPGGDGGDMKSEVVELRRELNASLAQIQELKADKLIQQEDMRSLKESVAALK